MAQQAAAAPRTRPIGVTILAILAGLAAALSAVHLLQALGIFPYVIGPVRFRDFNLWYVIMWALLVWVYVWLVQMLWRVDRVAWMFLVNHHQGAFDGKVQWRVVVPHEETLLPMPAFCGQGFSQ